MAFNLKNVVIGGESQPQELPTTPATTGADLTPEELAFILGILKNASLKGYQIELFYNLVVKIQNEYLRKTKK